MRRAQRNRRGPGPRARAVLLGLVGGALAGCYEGFDPLDPEVLAAVARSRGDAEGHERTGVYVGRFEPLECGCGGVDARYDGTLCTLIEWAEGLGLADQLDVELVQADGTARARALGLTGGFSSRALPLPVLYGSIQADGRITAAGVLQADSLIVRGEVLGRVDGIARDDETGVPVLELEYQQRYVLELFGGNDIILDGLTPGDDTIQTLDCRERVGLSLRFIGLPSDFSSPWDVPGG